MSAAPHAAAGSALDERRRFLEELFGDGVPGLIEVRPIVPDVGVRTDLRVFARTIDEAEQAVALAAAAGCNVYVGVCTRRRPGDGSKTNVWFAPALWTDIDFKDAEPTGAREALYHRIEGIAPGPPTFVVWTGGGVHLYWKLGEPLDLADAAVRTEFENRLRGLAHYFADVGGDSAATDANRILRVAGTTNWPDARKRAAGRTPVPCVGPVRWRA